MTTSLKTEDFVLVNINNTRTKVSLANGFSLREHRHCQTADLSSERLLALMAGWPVERALVASVVPTKTEIALSVFSHARQLTHELDLGVEVDFPDPSTIGADRLANAAAAAEFSNYSQRIDLDVGTAVTFYIVDTRPHRGHHLIAPGLDAMTHYLHERTALLPELSLETPPESVIGKSTEEAMLSGAYFGYRGLIRGLLDRVQDELGRPARVVATGGYAPFITRGMKEVDFVEPYFTMRGLLRIATRNLP